MPKQPMERGETAIIEMAGYGILKNAETQILAYRFKS
jgi:hypothetical protein